MTVLDDLHAGLQHGGDAEGMAFYRALADAELFLLLEAEAVGEVMSPRVFELADGPVVLAFDNEERLAGFADGPLAYAALPGRIIAGQMAGQGLSLGLNLGAGVASEVILPPEALDWLLAMLDQKAPAALQARVAQFLPPSVPGSVKVALASAVIGATRGYLVGVRYVDGTRGQLLALIGVDPGAESAAARAVTEALAFSGVEAGTLDVAFLDADDLALDRMSGMALVIEGVAMPVTEPTGHAGPGMDPTRPPNLR
ncbi:MAG: SseB family protein [Paracoccaceae bacterium]